MATPASSRRLSTGGCGLFSRGKRKIRSSGGWKQRVETRPQNKDNPFGIAFEQPKGFSLWVVDAIRMYKIMNIISY